MRSRPHSPGASPSSCSTCVATDGPRHPRARTARPIPSARWVRMWSRSWTRWAMPSSASSGHDRGARVGYRLAVDHPGRIDKLALLDIVPTIDVWSAIERGTGTAPHWPQLARPSPQPRTGNRPRSRRLFRRPHGSLDGRADLGRVRPARACPLSCGLGRPLPASTPFVRITGPGRRSTGRRTRPTSRQARPSPARSSSWPARTILWPANDTDPLAMWRRNFAPGAEGATIDCGHFLAEERPDCILSALKVFL